MERLVVLSALMATLLVELCNSMPAGAFTANQQNSGLRKQDAQNGAFRQQPGFGVGQLNEGQQYAANFETVMRLLAERDAQEAEWRRQEQIERENTLAELAAMQKRSGSSFHYYGARGKKAFTQFGEQQKRYNYMPSRG